MIQGYTYTTKNQKNSSEKYLIWHIQGGLGKNVAATALIKSIKEKYPDRRLILVCTYPEIFLNNPHIDRVYQLAQCPYFYEDYIEGKDSIVFRHEPYHQSAHIRLEKHLIENWCDLLNIQYTQQTPQIHINFVQKQLLGLWLRKKPVMVLQTCGGPMESQRYSYSWTRDMPEEVAKVIVDKYKSEYHIIQVTRPDGYSLQEVERVDQRVSNMELFALLAASKKRVLIDSCLQHAAAAFNLNSTVLWIGTSPVVFGYSLHKNVVADIPKKANQLIGSYLFDYQFENNIHECPYIELKDIFSLDKLNEI